MRRAALLVVLAACWSPEADLATCVAEQRCDPPAGSGGGVAGSGGGVAGNGGGVAGNGGGVAGGSAGGSTGGGSAGGAAGGMAGGSAGGSAGGAAGAGGGAVIEDDGGTCIVNGAWSWPCVDAELARSEDAGYRALNPTVELWRAPDAGSSVTGQRWAGAVYTPLGEVACMPYNARRVLFISPDGGMRLGPPLANAFVYNGGFYGRDGNIYGIPSTSQNAFIIRIDPATGAAMDESLPSGPSIGTDPRWCGAVSDVFGRAWLTPYGSSTIARFEPGVGSQLLPSPVDGGMRKWCTGSLLPDGRIFAVPQVQESVLAIDPFDGGARAIPTGISGARQGGAVLARNGTLYGVPQGYTDILAIAPQGTASSVYSANSQYNGGALSPEGRVVLVPEQANDVLVYSPFDGQVGRFATGQAGTTRWQGAATGKDGRVYACPHNADSVLVIDTTANRALPDRVLLSPWFNKR